MGRKIPSSKAGRETKPSQAPARPEERLYGANSGTAFPAWEKNNERILPPFFQKNRRQNAHS